MIDWAAFGIVAIVSIVAAALVVSLYAFGIKLLSIPAPDETTAGGAARDEETDDVTANGRPTWATVLACACFSVCGIAVLFGIYLIVPALHG